MDQTIPHSDNNLPFNFLMLILKILRNLSGGFTNYL